MKPKIIGINATLLNIERAWKYSVDKKYKELIAIGLVDGESEAKKKLKQDTHIDTGRLRASIHVEYWDNTPKYETHEGEFASSGTYRDDHGVAYEGKLKANPSEGEVYMGTNVEYAKFVENMDSFIGYAAKKCKQAMKSKKLTSKINYVKEGYARKT